MENFPRRFLVLLAVVNIASCQINERIVGGITGSIYDYPWLVSLRYQGSPACGASIISTQWLLTACHCFPKEHSVSDYDVVAATTNLEATDSSTQIFLIDLVIKHPSYNEDAYSGDIALVKIKGALTVGPGVGIINLVAADVQIPVGLPCVITGWGSIRNGVLLQNPKPVQVGSVDVISSSTCQCKYSINPKPTDTITSIQSDMICASNSDGSIDACQGDSGGPLSCDIDGKWYQIGVISWGDECAAPDRPGVYIRITAYADWIRQYVPDCQVQSITIARESILDDPQGCKGADGLYYSYPNRGTMVLATFLTLPLYWLSAYLLTNL